MFTRRRFAVLNLEPSWLSFNKLAETIASVLNCHKVSYQRNRVFSQAIDTANTHVISLSFFNKQHIERTFLSSPFAKRRIFYGGQNEIFEYGPAQRAAESLGAFFVSPSRFHLEIMKKQGYRNAFWIPHGYPPEFNATTASVYKCIRKRKSTRNKFTMFSNLTSGSRRKGLDYYLSAIGKTKSDFKAIIHVTSPPFNIPSSFDGRVEFITGYLSTQELVRLTLQADLIVVPSLFEGFGLPIIEAMRMGRPVLTLDGPAMNEINKAGYLVKVAKTEVLHRRSWTEILSIPNIEDYAQKIEDATIDREWEAKAIESLNLALSCYDPYKTYRKFECLAEG